PRAEAKHEHALQLPGRKQRAIDRQGQPRPPRSPRGMRGMRGKGVAHASIFEAVTLPSPLPPKSMALLAVLGALGAKKFPRAQRPAIREPSAQHDTTQPPGNDDGGSPPAATTSEGSG